MCNIAYRIAGKSMFFAGYHNVTRGKVYNATEDLTVRQKLNICYVLSGNDLFQIRGRTDVVVPIQTMDISR